MSDINENGIVYHIDIELLRRAREQALRKEIEKVEKQIYNAQQDLQAVGAAEQALAEVELVLGQMREIARKAANGTNVDRNALNKKFQQLKIKLDGIIKSANHNGINLLDGSRGDIDGIIAALNAALND